MVSDRHLSFAWLITYCDNLSIYVASRGKHYFILLLWAEQCSLYPGDYPSVCWWTFRLLLWLGCCEYCCSGYKGSCLIIMVCPDIIRAQAIQSVLSDHPFVIVTLYLGLFWVRLSRYKVHFLMARLLMCSWPIKLQHKKQKRMWG